MHGVLVKALHLSGFGWATFWFLSLHTRDGTVWVCHSYTCSRQIWSHFGWNFHSTHLQKCAIWRGLCVLYTNSYLSPYNWTNLVKNYFCQPCRDPSICMYLPENYSINVPRPWFYLGLSRFAGGNWPFPSFSSSLSSAFMMVWSCEQSSKYLSYRRSRSHEPYTRGHS